MSFLRSLLNKPFNAEKAGEPSLNIANIDVHQSPNWRTVLQESPIYTEDRIGLKTLDESGRLHLMAVEGNHLEFSRQWFIDEIINVYLKN